MKTIASLTIFCAIASSSVHAQYEYERYQRNHKLIAETPQIECEEEARPRKTTVQDKRVLVQSVKGIIVAGEGKLPPDYVIRSTRGVEFYRSMQAVEPTDREYLRKCLEKQYVGHVLTFEHLEEIKREVSRFYRKNGQALVMVSIPEQDVTEGVIVVTVLESRLGQVCILGAVWFCPERYRNYIRADTGDIIYNREIEADIAFINRNNWRKVNAIYKPGREIGTTDIDICVRDERPFNIYIGADNTGFKITNENRIFVGFQWGNVFGLDHTFSYQAIGSPNWSKFWAQMAHYIAPLPWRHVLEVFGGYSHVKVKNDFLPANVNSGKSYQISGRYVFPMVPMRALLQDFKAGIDWKRTNNDLVIGKAVVSKTSATVVQLVGGWEARADFCNHHIRAEAEAFLQPWSFGHTMNQAAYDALRPGASTKYLYLRGLLHYLWQDSRTMMGFDLKVRGQITTAALIPIEMFGLGGVYSVRGYEERAVNVDNGIIFNFEVRTPKLAVCGRMRSFSSVDEGLAAVFFFDMGAGHLKKVVPLIGQPQDYFLAGIGPGLRYDMGKWLHARFDIGIRLTDNPFGAASDHTPFFHWGVIAAY